MAYRITGITESFCHKRPESTKGNAFFKESISPAVDSLGSIVNVVGKPLARIVSIRLAVKSLGSIGAARLAQDRHRVDSHFPPLIHHSLRLAVGVRLRLALSNLRRWQ